MDSNLVAREVFDKALKLTMPARREELAEAFKCAGFVVAPDGSKVLSAGKGDYKALAVRLKSKLPTALIGVKRVLRQHGVSL